MRILFVSANSATAYLDIEREQRALQKIATNGGHYLRLLPAATFDDLKAELAHGIERGRPYNVIHFAGHASAEEGIVLRADSDSASPVPLDGPALSAMLEAMVAENRPTLVVLNACETETVAAAAGADVPASIGTKRAIKDTSAKRFTTEFYEALNDGEKITDAFKSAKGRNSPYLPPFGTGAAVGLPKAEEKDAGEVDGLGAFYDEFYGRYIEQQIGEIERDTRLNNYVFYGLLAIAAGIWVYLLQTKLGGVFWTNLVDALATALFPVDPKDPNYTVALFSLDDIWKRVNALESFAPVLIAFFQRTVSFRTTPKVKGLRKLRDAIRNWDDLAPEDQEMVRSCMHTSLKEALKS